MHDNEKKLVRDLSNIVGFNIYSLAKDLFDIAGFSKEFVVSSITKDGTVSFGSSNMLHWSVMQGWVVHSDVCDYEFEEKVREALNFKHKELIEEANA